MEPRTLVAVLSAVCLCLWRRKRERNERLREIVRMKWHGAQKWNLTQADTIKIIPFWYKYFMSFIRSPLQTWAYIGDMRMGKQDAVWRDAYHTHTEEEKKLHLNENNVFQEIKVLNSSNSPSRCLNYSQSVADKISQEWEIT